MSLEQFKSIEGYEGLYEVSSWGRVYRLTTQTFLNPETTTKGYLRVDLYDRCGKRKHMKVHRLVASAFIHNPQNKPQVNHKDGNPKNNSISNLEWTTNIENKRHQERLKRGECY